MARERLINRRRQGDLGEASAIEWLTSKGALVWFPIGHSPDVDLIATVDRSTLRIQVKTTTHSVSPQSGGERWLVSICTNGGNQSWTGVTKYFESTAVDYLFVLVGNGRRWLIEAAAVEGARGLHLGGVKYSEFEIEPGVPILNAVYGSDSAASKLDRPREGERRSRRAGSVCKIDGLCLSGFDSHLPHEVVRGAKGERALGRAGQAIVRRKRQMTIPAKPYDEAGLEVNDRIRFRAEGPGRVVLERIEPASNTLAADG